jgi:hypothetical protein
MKILNSGANGDYQKGYAFRYMLEFDEGMVGEGGLREICLIFVLRALNAKLGIVLRDL